MKTIQIDISDNIKGIECTSCDKRFILSKEEFENKGSISCPHCEKKRVLKQSWKDLKNLKAG